MSHPNGTAAGSRTLAAPPPPPPLVLPVTPPTMISGSPLELSGSGVSPFLLPSSTGPSSSYSSATTHSNTSSLSLIQPPSKTVWSFNYPARATPADIRSIDAGGPDAKDTFRETLLDRYDAIECIRYRRGMTAATSLLFSDLVQKATHLKMLEIGTSTHTAALQNPRQFAWDTRVLQIDIPQNWPPSLTAIQIHHHLYDSYVPLLFALLVHYKRVPLRALSFSQSRITRMGDRDRFWRLVTAHPYLKYFRLLVSSANDYWLDWKYASQWTALSHLSLQTIDGVQPTQSQWDEIGNLPRLSSLTWELKDTRISGDFGESFQQSRERWNNLRRLELIWPEKWCELDDIEGLVGALSKGDRLRCGRLEELILHRTRPILLSSDTFSEVRVISLMAQDNDVRLPDSKKEVDLMEFFAALPRLTDLYLVLPRLLPPEDESPDAWSQTIFDFYRSFGLKRGVRVHWAAPTDGDTAMATQLGLFRTEQVEGLRRHVADPLNLVPPSSSSAVYSPDDEDDSETRRRESCVGYQLFGVPPPVSTAEAARMAAANAIAHSDWTKDRADNFYNYHTISNSVLLFDPKEWQRWISDPKEAPRAFRVLHRLDGRAKEAAVFGSAHLSSVLSGLLYYFRAQADRNSTAAIACSDRRKTEMLTEVNKLRFATSVFADARTSAASPVPVSPVASSSSSSSSASLCAASPATRTGIHPNGEIKIRPEQTKLPVAAANYHSLLTTTTPTTTDSSSNASSSSSASAAKPRFVSWITSNDQTTKIYRDEQSNYYDILKVVIFTDANRRVKMRQFIQEWCALTELHGLDSVVYLTEKRCFVDPQHGELTMENLERNGNTSLERLCELPFTDDAQRVIGANIATSLAEIHRHQWMHGNLLLRNIWISASAGKAKFIDFSHALRTSQECQVIYGDPYSLNKHTTRFPTPPELWHSSSGTYGYRSADERCGLMYDLMVVVWQLQNIAKWTRSVEAFVDVAARCARRWKSRDEELLRKKGPMPPSSKLEIRNLLIQFSKVSVTQYSALVEKRRALVERGIAFLDYVQLPVSYPLLTRLPIAAAQTEPAYWPNLYRRLERESNAWYQLHTLPDTNKFVHKKEIDAWERFVLHYKEPRHAENQQALRNLVADLRRPLDGKSLPVRETRDQIENRLQKDKERFPFEAKYFRFPYDACVMQYCSLDGMQTHVSPTFFYAGGTLVTRWRNRSNEPLVIKVYNRTITNPEIQVLSTEEQRLIDYWVKQNPNDRYLLTLPALKKTTVATQYERELQVLLELRHYRKWYPVLLFACYQEYIGYLMFEGCRVDDYISLADSRFANLGPKLSDDVQSLIGDRLNEAIQGIHIAGWVHGKLNETNVMFSFRTMEPLITGFSGCVPLYREEEFLRTSSSTKQEAPLSGKILDRLQLASYFYSIHMKLVSRRLLNGMFPESEFRTVLLDPIETEVFGTVRAHNLSARLEMEEYMVDHKKLKRAVEQWRFMVCDTEWAETKRKYSKAMQPPTPASAPAPTSAAAAATAASITKNNNCHSQLRPNGV